MPREPFRTSFTFRQARGRPCDCAYPDTCDSQASPLPPTRKLQLLQAEGRDPAAASDTPAAAAPSDRGHSGAAVPCGEATAVYTSPASDACGACMLGPDGSMSGRREQGDAQLRMLEQEHVHRVYDAIAPHFSATRCVSQLLPCLHFRTCRRLSRALSAGSISSLVPPQTPLHVVVVLQIVLVARGAGSSV